MKTRFLLSAVCALACSSLIAAGDAPIRSGDTFELKIGGVPAPEVAAISASYTVDGEGNLNLPYINKVRAAGLTPGEIQNAVERTYMDRGIFTRPTVTVNIAATARLVTVGGEVNSKGRVPYTPDMTVLSAIGAAGDFTIYANQAKVRLIRGNNVKIINCKKIRANPSLDEKVLPGDNIQVEQSFF